MDGTVQRIEPGAIACGATEAIAEQREYRRLVEGGKTFHPVAIAIRDQSGIVGKPFDAVPAGPAPEVVQRLRQIPMIQAKPRFDAGCENGIDEPVVKCESWLIRRTATLRQNPRPGDGKTVGLNAELLHQGNIFGITVVVIASNVAGVMVGDAALQPVGVPDAEPAAVLARRALDLEGGGRHAPKKIAPQRRNRWKFRGAVTCQQHWFFSTPSSSIN